MALSAANQAWKQAGLSGAYPDERVGVMVGSSRGPLGKISESFERLGNGGLLPALSAQSSIASLAGALAQNFTLKGPGALIAATCASGAFASAFAAEQILLGKADAMLVGGAEAPLHAVVLAQLQSAGVLGSHEDVRKTCRPFDATRNGMVLGEGSAFFVLEPARLAARRGVPALARLAGWAVGIDDSGRTGVNVDGSGLTQVMTGALHLAGFSPGDIDCIDAHGSGTVVNDVAEARAVSRLFGDRSIPCSSTKPVTGHCLGATPALEAVLCIEALRRQMVLPTANCERLDPKCPIRVVTGEAQPRALAAVMSNSLGFWGYHASLIFARVESVY
jgi:3-oxoacyl-[acyl-carrier-protein] synthase II